MSFSSYEFVLAFLPVTIIVFWMLRLFELWHVSVLWLFVASFCYYCSYDGGRGFVPVFVLDVFVNYAIGLFLIKTEKKFLRKPALLLGLLLNLSLLFYYKYTGFFFQTTDRLLGTSHAPIDIMLPLGISFFTFRLISFVVDCYKGTVKTYSIAEFFLYAFYFPVIVMGPIVRHNEFIPQLRKREVLPFFKKGLFYFSVGLAKKVLLATPLIKFASGNLTAESTPFVLWLAMAANLFSFYFDFSGYSDMSLGISFLLGFELKENFRSPYKARNIQDYWKRWHISLTKFLTEYVFNNIYKPGHSTLRYCAATMITFVISGLWHGAGTNFILWGILHGICLSVIALLAVHATKKFFMPKFPARVITMVILLFAAGLYSFPSVSNYFLTVKKMFDPDFGFSISAVFDNLSIIIIIILSLVISFYTKNTAEISKKSSDKFWYPLWAGALLVISLFLMGETSVFLYQNF